MMIKHTNQTILFEDDDLLVINKPAGMVVNNAKSVRGLTVQTWFKEYLGSDYLEQIVGADQQPDWMSLLPDDFTDEYGSPTEIFLDRLGMVHRLDKDTSGALVLAKNPGSLINLMSQFKRRETAKKYMCLVHGKMTSDQDTIQLPIARSTRQRQKFAVDASGRKAETYFEVKQEFDFDAKEFVEKLKQQGTKLSAEQAKRLSSYQDGFSLVNAHPKTGRTHQIRVHFSYLQHPLVGDDKYLGKKRSKLDSLWCPRHFLHAAELSFKHPRTAEHMTINAPLSDDLELSLSFI